MIEKGDVYKTDDPGRVLVILSTTGCPYNYFLYYPTSIVTLGIGNEDNIIFPVGVICSEQCFVEIGKKKYLWITHPTPGYFLQKMDKKYLPFFGWSRYESAPGYSNSRKWVEEIC